MPLTKAQRSHINRQNAAQSTGPKSDEGKARSRRNALKHGLRAENLDLPNEVPGAFEALAQEWHDFYQPDSPGESALIDRAVHATIQLKRCAAFHTEAVARQVRAATEAWDDALAEELAGFDALLWSDTPAPGVAGLKHSAAGCALLLDEWTELLEALDRGGRFDPADRDRALRLCGQHPDKYDANPLAYLIRYYNLFSLTNPNPEMMVFLAEPKRIPPQLRGALSATNPGPEESRAALREIVELEIEALRARQARLQVLADADRDGAADRALLLGGADGGLLLRYEKMHDGAFHRAYSALLKGRKDKVRAEVEPIAAPAASLAPIEPKPVAPIEPEPVIAAPEPVPQADAPNEAKLDALLALIDDDGEVSGDFDAACAAIDEYLFGWTPAAADDADETELDVVAV